MTGKVYWNLTAWRDGTRLPPIAAIGCALPSRVSPRPWPARPTLTLDLDVGFFQQPGRGYLQGFGQGNNLNIGNGAVTALKS